MYTLARRQYWPVLIDYFYDNVYPTIYHLSTWIELEYRGRCDLYSNYIIFDNPHDKLRFMLKWGHKIEA